MEARFFNDAQGRRIERILDETLVDLKIEAAAPHARNAREFIARVLFDTQADSLPDPIATRTLVARVRSFGATGGFNSH